MPEWIDPLPPSAPSELKDAVGGHPVVAELLAQRGIRTPREACSFFDPDEYRPASPYELPGMERAVRRVEEAIRKEEEILVWGDFDVDGQTSTALLVSALKELGAGAGHHIPHRQKESHGVNVPFLKRCIEEGAGLVLTCDTGVASQEAIRFANARGVDVVVTDHHDLPPRLPDAHAIVNPKQLKEGHALRTLPGVGVAYKLVEALFERAGEDPARYLDLVALGIVADLAYLSGDTRYLLQRGLEKLRRTRRPGLLAVMSNAGVEGAEADEEDIGFRIGPRLNALGRLADASVAVELLTTESRSRAAEIAGRLEELNDRRRLLTDQVHEAARRQIDKKPELLQYAALVLFQRQWPSGVIGIVASRLAEQYHKPTVLVTSSEEGMARGSARSIEGIDISAAISSQEEMLGEYGGHPMAAGLSLAEENVGRFRRLLSRSIVQQRGGEELERALKIDAFVQLGELTLEFADDIGRLAPFGPGNRLVTLACRSVSVAESREIGGRGDHLEVTVAGREGGSQSVLYWNASKRDLPSGRFDLALTLSSSSFRGERSVQLTWEDARPAGKAPPAETRQTSALDVIDRRSVQNPAALLRKLARKKDAQVWMEGGSASDSEGKRRTELSGCRELIIGTLPPSRSVVQAALRAASPEVVHVIGMDPGLDALEPFAGRLMGLAKHLIREKKSVPLCELAAAMAHEEGTVGLGLRWLESRGLVEVHSSAEGVALGEGAGSQAPDEEHLRSCLKEALEEAAAFREFARTEEWHALAEQGRS